MNEFKVKNGLIVEGQAVAQGVTSSLFGTASWAQHTISSSYSEFAVTSSFALNFNPNATASYAIFAQTASYLTPGTYQITSSWSLNAITASFLNGNATGSFFGTASWATNAVNTQTATSASFALFSNASLSSSWASASISSSFASTSSFLNGFNFDNTSSVLPQTSSLFVVAQKPTGSFLAAFFDYAANSGSNIRAGTVFGAWTDNTASYAEYCTVDRGDTSQVTMSLIVTQSLVQLLSTVSTSANWTIRTLVRYI